MTLLDNLKLYFKLDGNSTDFSGNSNNGIDTAITYSEANGKIIQGAVFNGSTSKIQLNNNVIGNKTSNRTYNMWVKVANFNSAYCLYSNTYDLNFEGEYGIYILQTTGYITSSVHATRSPSDTWISANSTTAPTLNIWNMITFTITMNGYIKIYLNGQEINSTAYNYSSILGDSSTSARSRFGSVWNNTLFFNGVQDEIGIWSRALTANEVLQLYNGGAGLTYPFVSANANFLQLF